MPQLNSTESNVKELIRKIASQREREDAMNMAIEIREIKMKLFSLAFEQAHEFIKASAMKEAIDSLKNALEYVPDKKFKDDILFLLGTCYKGSDNHIQAYKYFSLLKTTEAIQESQSCLPAMREQCLSSAQKSKEFYASNLFEEASDSIKLARFCVTTHTDEKLLNEIEEIEKKLDWIIIKRKINLNLKKAIESLQCQNFSTTLELLEYCQEKYIIFKNHLLPEDEENYIKAQNLTKVAKDSMNILNLQNICNHKLQRIPYYIKISDFKTAISNIIETISICKQLSEEYNIPHIDYSHLQLAEKDILRLEQEFEHRKHIEPAILATKIVDEVNNLQSINKYDFNFLASHIQECLTTRWNKIDKKETVKLYEKIVKKIIENLAAHNCIAVCIKGAKYFIEDHQNIANLIEKLIQSNLPTENIGCQETLNLTSPFIEYQDAPQSIIIFSEMKSSVVINEEKSQNDIVATVTRGILQPNSL